MLCARGSLSFVALWILWAVSVGACSAESATADSPPVSSESIVTDAGFGPDTSSLTSPSGPVAKNSKTYALSMHGDVKYKEGEIFNAVNPNAPQGGTLRFGVVGTFDSTNPFIDRGTPPAGLSLFSEPLVFETLMKRSYDEPFTLYGLLAQYVEVAPDHSAVTFYLNPKARWADGRPVLAEDVKFSFEILRDKGRLSIRRYYNNIASCEILGDRTIRFTFKRKPHQKESNSIEIEVPGEALYDREQPLIMGLMSIIPKHIYEKYDFEKVSLDAVVASGPYRIKSIRPGHSIVYGRRADYWGKDLAVTQGEYNFQTVSIDYYRDNKIAYEAFKAGEYDVYRKISPGGWENQESYPALKKGLVKQIEWSHGIQVGFQGLVMNTRRALFQDIRVRKALVYAFDFETLNRTLLKNGYERSLSHFSNTDLASYGIPKDDELALLLPFKDQLARDVFEKEFTLPKTNGRGGMRVNLQIARRLLKDADWVMRQGKLYHQKTGAPFHFEILLYDGEHLKFTSAFAQNLKSLGIQASLRTVDTAHYEARRLIYDYDMIVQFWGHTLSPGQEQSLYWSSASGEEPGSYNYPGIKCSVVDTLCDSVVQAQNRTELKTAVHALDRVLLWGHYTIPLFHTNKIRLAYWDKFGYPEIDPHVGVRFTTWWSKEK